MDGWSNHPTLTYSSSTPNGSAFNGRPGTEPGSNHKDRSARLARCSAWLSRGRIAEVFGGLLKPCDYL
jgi:hypothetical protein